MDGLHDLLGDGGISVRFVGRDSGDKGWAEGKAEIPLLLVNPYGQNGQTGLDQQRDKIANAGRRAAEAIRVIPSFGSDSDEDTVVRTGFGQPEGLQHSGRSGFNLMRGRRHRRHRDKPIDLGDAGKGPAGERREEPGT